MTEERQKVWPARGLTVRDPLTRQPIEPGTEVALTREVLRLIRSGDLTTKDPAAHGDQEHGVERDDGTDREKV